MSAVTDNFVEERIREAIRRADWKWEKYQVGSYVCCRLPPYTCGRIVARIVKDYDVEAIKLLRSPYVVYRVRYLDGQIFDEHPEHLDVTDRPVLKIVR